MIGNEITKDDNLTEFEEMGRKLLKAWKPFKIVQSVTFTSQTSGNGLYWVVVFV